MPLAAAQTPLSESSPDQVRLSLAAALTLGLAEGRFYRNARLGCINLLLTYPDGCKANCAFCGLARESQVAEGDPRFQKFIRVTWKAYDLDEVVARCAAAPPHVERVCVSMVTHLKAKADVLEVCRRVREGCHLPVSLLIAPTLLKAKDLEDMKQAGADRIGVAIDAATPELFAQLRGKPAGGPHRWEHYWSIYEESARIFGRDMIGVHLIHGLGETERELVLAIDRARALGGSTHLFCFFPERFSALADTPQPPASGYRRIQLARWLIDHDQARAADMRFDQQGRIEKFGAGADVVEAAIASGRPFMTSGCPGASGEVACNRPYGNERPGPDLRNYPFPLIDDDIALVRRQLGEY
ncbi:MAG: radical SAM protein [Desulfarculaceae bacterium]|nr:radical SAM protein [Desulfarculaceae bacterium]MCF8072896.1 radical SAM protein [Desulfarculaceae bacterium]MCF8101064.1 radical SAM protein [Desulfarculaceae bacterium]MCF8115549.1 radical SAM protein [Desulfarculaceae bacterium]